jgi:hypothetical protein
MFPALFWIAALYDGVLGIAFLGWQDAIFDYFETTPPNHPGYVHFAAGILLTFTALFAQIATNPRRYRDLIPYGMLLKVCYCGTVFGHWALQGIPDMWQPFAFADLIFLVLFWWAWDALGRDEAPAFAGNSLKVQNQNSNSGQGKNKKKNKKK